VVAGPFEVRCDKRIGFCSEDPCLPHGGPCTVILGGWQSSSFSSYETPNRREASTVKDALLTQRLHEWELHARLPALSVSFSLCYPNPGMCKAHFI
jgi:hypothetical protein